jgi:hypothetical protein
MSERDIGTQYLLQKCAEKYNDPNIKNTPFDTSDRGTDKPNIYTMCYDKTKPHLEKFCGPDYVFHNWKSASIFFAPHTIMDIIEASETVPQINKVGWHGNIHSPLKDVIEYKTRPLLFEIGQKYPQWFDIFHISPVDSIISKYTAREYMSLPDLVRNYKYLIDIGGNGWSGRLKFLLFSRRPLLLVDRKYIDYFYKDLLPYVHYIPVKEDLSDLLSQTECMMKNEDICKEIAENAFQFAVENFVEDKLMERVYSVYNNVGNLRFPDVPSLH